MKRAHCLRAWVLNVKSRTWILDSTQAFARLILMQDKKIICCDVGIDSQKPSYGEVYQAKVLKSLSNAPISFLDLGQGLEAILPMSERSFPRPVEGETVVTQITREADLREGKLAVATRSIEIQVGPLLWMNYETGLKFSKKIGAQKRAHLEKLLPNAEGILVRSNVECFSDDEILGCFEALRTPQPSCFIKNILNQSLPSDKIIVDTLKLYREFSKAVETHPYHPQLIFDRAKTFDENLEEAWENMFEARVEISGGGNVIIEQTHAFISVDINALSTTLPKFAFLKKAIEAIFQEIRKRDLAGIILIDLPFSLKEQGDILGFAKKEAQLDLNPPQVYGITKLGILELSRKMRRRPLPDRIV